MSKSTRRGGDDQPFTGNMEENLKHFASDLLRFLHAAHRAENFFDIEVLSANGEWVGVFSKTDGVVDDRITVDLTLSREAFFKKVQAIQPPGVQLTEETWNAVRDSGQPILGYTRRQIYMIRAGYSADLWTTDQAYSQIKLILLQMEAILAPAIAEEWRSLQVVSRTWSEFEDLVRRSVNCLFGQSIGEARAQSRTDNDPGQERRDVVAHNRADSGFWNDLKIKFNASELLFEVKHKTVLDRDDLRQTYCYLKPSLGYFGFLVFCGPKERDIIGYNQTLFRNFSGDRGVLMLNHEDFIRMLEIKLRNGDPTDYLRSVYSAFNQAV